MRKITLFFVATMVCLVLTGCDEKYNVSEGIPDAENAIFTPSGRLFVTGGTNIYEIFADGSALGLCPEGKYNFTGMARVGNYLYAVATEYRFDCSSIDIGDIDFFSPSAVTDFVNLIVDIFKQSVLLCAEIVPGDLSFTEIYTIEDTLIPNGMVADNQGRLYVADETFLPMGKIVRLQLDEPLSVVFQETWLDAGDDVFSPNGMSIRENNIYFSDFNILSLKQTSLKKVAIAGNGAPGNIATLYERMGFFDDLSAGTVFNTDVVVAADFLKGTLVFIRDNGQKQNSPLFETRMAMFDCPSSVTFGKAPMFADDELVVTEKGMMFEHTSGFGNKVSAMVME